MALFRRSIGPPPRARSTDFERESAVESQVGSPVTPSHSGRDRIRKWHGRDHTTYANITGLFLVRGGVDETATADNCRLLGRVRGRSDPTRGSMRKAEASLIHHAGRPRPNLWSGLLVAHVDSGI
jgi:hypothetical protein